MTRLSLKVENYERILSFMDDINVETPKFRKEVLFAFEDLFGIERMNFWLCDEQNNIIDPVTNNISQDVTKDYLNNYLKEDPLLPDKVIHILPKRRVIVLTNDLPKTKYVNNDYFNGFMRKNGLYDCTTLFLVKDHRVLGLLDFSLRNRKKLSQSEMMSLEILTRFLTERFHEHLSLQQSNLPANGVELTVREEEVLRYVQKGLSNKQIADLLFISVNTVKKHVQSLYDKFEVNNRTSLTYKVNHIKSNMMKIS